MAIVEVTSKTYFNSKIDNIHKEEFQYPKFKIIGITKDTDSKYNTIAKYEVSCSFFSKENARGFRYNRFYFYDKVDMYKIGDILTLTQKY